MVLQVDWKKISKGNWILKVGTNLSHIFTMFFFLVRPTFTMLLLGDKRKTTKFWCNIVDFMLVDIIVCSVFIIIPRRLLEKFIMTTDKLFWPHCLPLRNVGINTWIPSQTQKPHLNNNGEINNASLDQDLYSHPSPSPYLLSFRYIIYASFMA